MKLEFKDKFTYEALELSFEINDNIERDITPLSAEIKWSLVMDYKDWGISQFNYELSLMVMTIRIETMNEDGTISNDELFAEVKFNPKKRQSAYVCRIYEDVIDENNKLVEEEYVRFPIELVVEEKPETPQGNRSQIYVKYIQLDLTSESKTLTLTI